MRIPLKGGDENDALTRWKRLIKWRPGQRKSAKKTYQKRLRQMAKAETKTPE